MSLCVIYRFRCLTTVCRGKDCFLSSNYCHNLSTVIQTILEINPCPKGSPKTSVFHIYLFDRVGRTRRHRHKARVYPTTPLTLTCLLLSDETLRL